MSKHFMSVNRDLKATSRSLQTLMGRDLPTDGDRWWKRRCHNAAAESLKTPTPSRLLSQRQQSLFHPCALMQQKNCAPLTSDFFPRHSWGKRLMQLPGEGECENVTASWVCCSSTNTWHGMNSKVLQCYSWVPEFMYINQPQSHTIS